MKFIQKISSALALMTLSGALVPAMFAQGDSSSPSTSSQQNTDSQQNSGDVTTAPGPAPERMNVENPPLSGLDQPQAEPAYGGRSYLLPGLQLSESADSNASGTASTNTSVTEVSRALGSIDLQKIGRRSQFGLDYIGGGAYYVGPHFSNQARSYQEHTLAGEERILWRTGELGIRDSFSYLPQGSFGFNSYGGAGSFGSALGGGVTGVGAGSGMGGGLTGGTSTGLMGGGTIGSVGFQPRISNSSIVDIVEELSPRTSITLAGAYDFTRFLKTSQSSFNTINSQDSSGQIGFNRLLNRKDQIGVLYAFEELHFPISGTGTVQTQVWNALYGHRITGRLNLVLGGGPQLVTIEHPAGSLGRLFFGPSTRTLSGSGKVELHYTVTTRTNAEIQYQHYVSPGSGFYAGANSDVGRISLGHLFGRHWNVTTDGGYSHNSSLQNNLAGAGINSQSYEFWYVGASMRHELGVHFDAFASYQFNDFGSGQCTTSGSNGVCGQRIPQHVGAIGIDWHPRPIRLD